MQILEFTPADFALLSSDGTQDLVPNMLPTEEYVALDDETLDRLIRSSSRTAELAKAIGLDWPTASEQEIEEEDCDLPLAA